MQDKYNLIEQNLQEVLYGAHDQANLDFISRLDKMIQGYLQNFPFLKQEFPSKPALDYIINECKDIQTVLDIGSGEGYQSKAFLESGKTVTAIEYGKQNGFQVNSNYDGVELIIGDFLTYNFDKQYDCVWASHVLEHQLDAQTFLTKLVNLTKENGIIAISVPPFKSEIVGGHVSLWNSGLLLYRLILAGCDCSNASVKQYGYNISVIVRKKHIDNVLDKIAYVSGDLDRVKEYFPKEINWYPEAHTGNSLFDGNIRDLNW